MLEQPAQRRANFILVLIVLASVLLVVGVRQSLQNQMDQELKYHLNRIESRAKTAAVLVISLAFGTDDYKAYVAPEKLRDIESLLSNSQDSQCALFDPDRWLFVKDSEWLLMDTAESIPTLDALFMCEGNSIVAENLVLERQPNGRRLVVNWKILKIGPQKWR